MVISVMARDRPVVMLVDDEPGILSALRRVLRREGFEILLAGNAREALDELEDRCVDLVISDHKMPGISGVRWNASHVATYPGPGDTFTMPSRSKNTHLLPTHTPHPAPLPTEGSVTPSQPRRQSQNTAPEWQGCDGTPWGPWRGHA